MIARRLGVLFAPFAAITAVAIVGAATAAASPTAGCRLQSQDGAIKHVIYLQFDNTHFSRDNPNVPSDLEQMPHLSSLTGLYPDRMGTTVSNSYDFYQPNGKATFTSAFKYWTAPVAGGVDDTPNMVNGDSGQPKTTPAPWVSYTRAGCDVGNVSVANTVLENNNAVLTPPTTLAAAAAAGATNIKVASVSRFSAGQQIQVDDQFVGVQSVGTADAGGTGVTLTAPLAHAHASGAQVIAVDPTGDMTTIFGQGTPEWNEGKASQLAASGSAARALAQTDFVGIAVHCAQNPTSVCNKPNGAPNAKSDLLPDEPGGYTGYKALFGAKYVDPAIAGGSPAVNDINGNPITDGFNQPGFPGFDSMSAANSLGYVAKMQEAGIPITFAYISDVHDNHAGGGAYGPGEADYVQALKTYDDAFAKFFERLAADGINKHNTLFVVTADENDHFAGQQAQSCDGVNTPCVYNSAAGNPRHGIFDVTNGATTATDPSAWNGPTTWPPATQNGPLVGEVGYNAKWLLGSTINGAGYDISFDSAPSFYIDNQPQAVDASGHVVLNPVLRAFERKAANLKAFDPYIDPTKLTPVARYLVDAPTLKALHMINADPQRTMPFTMFAQPDYFLETFSPCPTGQGCVNDGFAWIHGDYSGDIGQTWLGMAGPGVAHDGVDNTTWTDHADIVPTMMSLVGLKTDYVPDGRVITQVARGDGDDSRWLQRLGDIYKQLDAPYGDFNHSLVVASTAGIKADDATYLSAEAAIQSLTSQRDALVGSIRQVLDGGHRRFGDRWRREHLIQSGRNLLARAAALAASL